MDLDYLRQHPRTLPLLIEHQRIRTTPLPTRGGCTLERLTLDDGTTVLAKSHPAPPPGFFAAEAAGLEWLAEARAVHVPEVIVVTERMLVLTWVDDAAAEPSRDAAESLGRGLAELHRAGAPAFGAGWPGFAGLLPVGSAPRQDWATFYVGQRLAPALRAARDRGAVSAEDAAVVELALDQAPSLAGRPEPPARLHGDLRRSTVLWSGQGPWLVGPAAYGGHRESDLAALGLTGPAGTPISGVPQVDRVLAAYQEVWPLAAGWRDRAPLHELYPLLVRAALAGGDWGRRAVEAARRLL